MGFPDIESAGKVKPAYPKADLDRPVAEVMEGSIVSLTDIDVRMFPDLTIGNVDTSNLTLL